MAIAEHSPTTRPRIPGWKRRVAVAAALPGLVHPTARLLARSDYRADVLTHFQVPALAASIFGAAALWTLGRYRWAAAGMAGLAAWQAASLLRYEGPNPVAPAPGAASRWKVLMANVLGSNHEHHALLGLVARERPDVVALVEFDDRWRRSMGPLREAYPHHIEIPNGTRGLALYSRFPIRDEPPPVVVTPMGDGNPALAATIDLDEGGFPLNLWVLHPPNPIAADGRGRGRDEFLWLAGPIARRQGPTLVVGDMNRTEGSPIFGDFLRLAGLRDSRLGFGRQPSWPVGSPYRIALDHAFVGPELAVVDRRLGPAIGSDHRPLVIELAPSASSESIPTTSATQRSASSPR